MKKVFLDQHKHFCWFFLKFASQMVRGEKVFRFTLLGTLHVSDGERSVSVIEVWEKRFFLYFLI